MVINKLAAKAKHKCLGHRRLVLKMWEEFQDQRQNSQSPESTTRQELTLVLGHPLRPGRLTGARWSEDVWVTDTQLQVEEAGGGGDAAVLGVGLLHWITVLQSVDTHPGLIWRRRREEERRGGEERQQPVLAKVNLDSWTVIEPSPLTVRSMSLSHEGSTLVFVHILKS